MDKHMATEMAYKNGYEAGKQSVAKELLEELNEVLTAKLESFNTLKEDPELAAPLTHASEYWEGRAAGCKEILKIVELFKIRYEVK